MVNMLAFGYNQKGVLGAVAQLGEHLICIQRVGGSNPPSSTKWTLDEILLFPWRVRCNNLVLSMRKGS